MADHISPELTAKNTWLRRYLVLAGMKLRHLLKLRPSPVNFFTPWICVKASLHLSEAETMRFIAANTSIPVPKIYCAFKQKGINYIVMSRINGFPIGMGWNSRTEESKAKLLQQLRGYIQEMRSLKPPRPGAIEGVNGAKVYDVRIPDGMEGFGPFDTVLDFNHFITGNCIMDHPPPINEYPDIDKLIESYKSPRTITKFTHGDLNCSNILVKGDEVVGIVDWDTSGWYPEYWEYTTASIVSPYFQFWADDAVDKFLDPYPKELEVDEVRVKWFSNF